MKNKIKSIVLITFMIFSASTKATYSKDELEKINFEKKYTNILYELKNYLDGVDKRYYSCGNFFINDTIKKREEFINSTDSFYKNLTLNRALISKSYSNIMNIPIKNREENIIKFDLDTIKNKYDYEEKRKIEIIITTNKTLKEIEEKYCQGSIIHNF